MNAITEATAEISLSPRSRPKGKVQQSIQGHDGA